MADDRRLSTSARSRRAIACRRIVARLACAVGVIGMLSCACVHNLGTPARPDDPTESMALAADFAERGDPIAADHLLSRVQARAAGSTLGIVATLQRHRIGPDGRRIALYSGSDGDARLAAGGLSEPADRPRDVSPPRSGTRRARVDGLERCR